jgi:hypothetical protein
MVDFVFLWQMSEMMFDRSLEYSMLPLGGLFRKDRKDGFGGVMLAIKSNINSNPIDITTVTNCDRNYVFWH